MIKQLVRFVAVCLSASAFCALASTPAVSLIGGPNSTTTTSYPLIVGWKFNVNSPVSLDSLGLYINISNYAQVGPTSGDVGLWDASSALLTSASVVETDPVVDGFRYHPVSPITLLPGQDYIVGALLLHSEAFSWYGNPLQVASEINFVTRLYDYFPNGLSSPPSNPDMGGFGPSFTFTAVPEPSGLAIMPAIAAILGVRRRGRTSADN